MIVELNSFICHNSIGNKAKSLVDLNRYGFKVPKSIVIDTNEYKKITESIKKKIDLLMKKLKEDNIEFISKQILSLFDKVKISEKILIEVLNYIDIDEDYILRTSIEGVSNNYSFSGIFPVMDEIDSTNIESNIIECYKNLFSYNSLYYMMKNNLDYNKISVAVMIQNKVKERCLGVVTTINPVTLNTNEIELNLYTNDIKEKYIYDISSNDFLYKDKYKLLNKNRVDDIIETVLNIQANFGYPLEIELALTKSDNYIIQAREISTIEYKNMDGIWKSNNISPKKFMYSLYSNSYNKIINNYQILGDIDISNNTCIKFNKSYFNLVNLYKIFNSFVKVDKEFFSTTFEISDMYFKKRKLKDIIKRFKNKKKYNNYLNTLNTNHDINIKYEKLYNEYLKKLLKIGAKNIEKEWNELVIEICSKMYDEYFDYLMISYIESNKLYNKLSKHLSVYEYNDLINDFKKESLKSVIDFNKLVKVIDSDEDSYKYWFSSSTLKIVDDYNNESSNYFHPQFRKYIDNYGYLSYNENDLSENFYVEDIEEVVRELKKKLSRKDDLDIERNDVTAILDKLKNSLSDKKYESIKLEIDKVKELKSNTDIYNIYIQKFNFMIKRFTKMLAKLYFAKDLIEDESDIWYLGIHDINNYIDGEIGKEDIKKIISKNRYKFNSFRNINSSDYIGEVKKSINEDIKGIGLSSKIVSGKARFIKSLEELNNMEENDILITKTLNNNLLFHLPKIKGIVISDLYLSNSCKNIIRELDIPCLIIDSCSVIKDNTFITLDCHQGIVSLKKQ